MYVLREYTKTGCLSDRVGVSSKACVLSGGKVSLHFYLLVKGNEHRFGLLLDSSISIYAFIVLPLVIILDYFKLIIELGVGCWYVSALFKVLSHKLKN